MSRLTHFTNDLAGIGESSALKRVHVEIHQAGLAVKVHRDAMIGLEYCIEEGGLALIGEWHYHNKWFKVFSSRLNKLRAKADSIREGLERALEEEPPVRTGRFTRERLRYERGCGSKPDQTRSRAARLRSIERRGFRR